MILLIQKSKKINRNPSGFTLSFALILAVIFSSLLGIVLYFLKSNSDQAAYGIYKTQAIYLAESGNARAMALLNVKTLPEIKLDDQLLNKKTDDRESFSSFSEDEDDDSIAIDDASDEDFDEEFADSYDEDADNDADLETEDADEDLSSTSNEERRFLAKIPRYINFYHENKFFINIDTGHIVTETNFYSLIEQQKMRQALNKSQGAEDPVLEIPIEELYFPLPEVNVKKIGLINIPKNTHLKPGYKISIADKVKVDLKQKNILEEYLNFVPGYSSQLPKPRLYGLSPNKANPGEYLNVQLDGENVQDLVPELSSMDLHMVGFDGQNLSLELDEKTAIGRYRIKFGSAFAEFYVVPRETDAPSPIIDSIVETKSNKAFDMMGSQDSRELTIHGENLGNLKSPSIIVPDNMGITIETQKVSDKEITCTIKTLRASPGEHYIEVFTEGGHSRSWTFRVEKTLDQEILDPKIAKYSTTLTLLEIKSLANLPIKSSADAGLDSEGRPDSVASSRRPSGDSDLPQTNSNVIRKKTFDLLRSDLDTVWKLETIATVNKVTYKETKIIRRSVPQVEAALTANTQIGFGQSSILIKGLVEALTRLVKNSSYGDKTILVEGQDRDQDFFSSRNEEEQRTLSPTGDAVVEKFYYGSRVNSLEAKGFTPGSLISVASLNRTASYEDINSLKSVSARSLTVFEPGFDDVHFVGDEVIQFKPSIIFPYEISEREAQRSLDPPGTYVALPGREDFSYVFRTRLDKIVNWSKSKTRNTKVPLGQKDLYQGYFGLNIIEGSPTYSGANSLYGQGILIIDTTLGGANTAGGLVIIGGSSKAPSTFDGLIYIIGDLLIDGPVEISGGIIVNSPLRQTTTRISGAGSISYSPESVKKSILHLPFSEELHSRVLLKSKEKEGR